ncbi:hypothetical protein HUJ04_000372 [Dendroctonus ponderosae]|nr:hypothetical protein HUJ04_000372 [Dendroctonus ponderosae]
MDEGSALYGKWQQFNIPAYPQANISGVTFKTRFPNGEIFLTVAVRLTEIMCKFSAHPIADRNFIIAKGHTA